MDVRLTLLDSKLSNKIKEPAVNWIKTMSKIVNVLYSINNTMSK